MPVIRLTAQWVGFPGSPGYSNFHFAYDNEALTEVDASAAKLRTFIATWASYMPTGVNIVMPSVADVFDVGTGALQETLPVGALANVTGAASSIYAGPSGGVVGWSTGVVNAGRRIRGRTFLVPMSQAFYQADGTVIDAGRTAIQAGANSFIGNASGLTFGIWSRPRPGPVLGVLAPVTAALVPDKVAVLRSRRD